MKEFGYCCESVIPHYELADQPYLSEEPQHIHHVETFIPREGIETVEISTLISRYYRAWNAHIAAEESDDEVPPELVDMTFLNYRNVCLHNIQRNSQHRFPRDYPVALTPQSNFTGPDNASTRNKCKNSSIQLIVCRTCPTQAIAHFDMDICKSNFDGKLVRIVSMNDTFNFRTKAHDYMQFINCYIPYYFQGVIESYRGYSPLESFYTSTLNRVTLNHVSDTEVSDEMLIHITQCMVKTAKNVDSRTQVTVLGTDNFKLLYSGSSIDYTPKYFVALHNKLVILLQRALKYIKRGIDVPLSDNVKELLGYAFHNDNVVPPSKRICHDYACGI